MLFQNLLQSAVVAGSLLAAGVDARKTFGERVRDRVYRSAAPEPIEVEKLEGRDTSSYRYYNNKTSKYFVKSLPEVNYNLGEMYSGEIPVNMTDKSRNLFYIFQPKIGDPVDEITIWLNGGPGCSSLEGFFQENGMFLWQPGVYAPTTNPYSWVNLTNMLWVEQPVGTGFSTGKVTATRQEDIAADFVNWFGNFQKAFNISNYKIYVTGESYAGRYVPYISAAMLDKKDKTNYDLSGALVYDPCIGQFDYVQEEVPVVPYVNANNNLFNFNSTFLTLINTLHETCGYQAYIDKYLTFPPPGMQPQNTFSPKCDIFSLVNFEALHPNPCFDIYEINQMCPLLGDVLAFPTELVYSGSGVGTTYFNRPDVKKALHAPANVQWAECANNPVFVGTGGPEGEGDLALDPIQHVLPQVIEATNRVLVSNGDYDMIIITNGTLMAIQNMTWGGKLGFQRQPATPIIITEPDLQYNAVFADNGVTGYDEPQGIMGVQHYERGLMWAQTYQSGHMQPEFQPRVTYRHLEWLLGRVQTL